MLVELTDIDYEYLGGSPGAARALSGVSLGIESGEFVALIGKTGSGKSTLTQIMAGILEPSTGSVRIEGRDLWGDKRQKLQGRASVGLVMQQPERQLFETTVADDVAFWPKNAGVDGDAIEQLVDRALERVGLTPDTYRHRSPFSLSGGEMRKVAIAGVLVMEPRLLLLDEPTVGLDPHGRRELLEYITGLNRDGTTIVMVTHDIDMVAELADRVLVVEEGRLAADSTPGALFSHRSGQFEELPGASMIARELARGGFAIEDEPITLDELADSIIRTSEKASV